MKLLSFHQNETIMKGKLDTVQSLAGTNFENNLEKGFPKINETSIYQIHFQQGLFPDQKKQQVANNQQNEIEID